MLRRPQNKNPTFRLTDTEDGLHLVDSILWLDAKASCDVSFLSSATALNIKAIKMAIATEETTKLIGVCKQAPSSLTCQYNRPFSIGRLKMELLPSGSILGGASLYIETDKGQLLYAPSLQPQKIPTAHKLQLKRAETLIIRASHCDPTKLFPVRKKEKERFVEMVKMLSKAGEPPIILCDPFSTAPEITQLLCENGIPTAVHDFIFRINQVYESCGSKLGKYTKYSKHTKNKAIILPMIKSASFSMRSPLPDGPTLVIENGHDESLPMTKFFRSITARFKLPTTCDGQELKQVISLVNPKELLIFGPYTKSYVKAYEGLCPVIAPLYPNDQPTLF